MKNVIGIGNALTDILVHIGSDTVLEKFSLPLGSMNLVDRQVQKAINEHVAEMPRALSLGGSASNTIRALAKLGTETGYIGKVGTDETGNFFEQAMNNLGVMNHIYRGSEPSGQCMSLISANCERTMCTYLGAALELAPHELSPDKFKGFDCLYLEGFLVQDHALILEAVKIAKGSDMKVALDLASFNVVEENFDFLQILANDYVDILFANEQEAESFTGESKPLEALDKLARHSSVAVLKVGNMGAYIKHEGQVDHVGVMPIGRCVDTTGAGDFYAAGFLSGMCKGLSMPQCGTIGAIAAGNVVQIAGTTFDEETWAGINSLVGEVQNGRYIL